MENTKLWWLVRCEDGAFRFVFKTYDEVLDEYFQGGSEIAIVHPDNLMYPEKLREYNRQHEDVIFAYHALRLSKLVEIEAPEVCIHLEATRGMLSSHCPIVSEWVSPDEYQEEKLD
ncbi:MAG: hypothetical protein KBS81_05000 [Spirochaetales bacterium]|nr:hypothetical protein [Candidatus Physcosoma equi]